MLVIASAVLAFFRRGEIADNSLRLYALLSRELWCRTFLDRSWSFDAISEAGTATEARATA